MYFTAEEVRGELIRQPAEVTNTVFVSFSNRGLMESYLIQSHPRQSEIMYRYIQQFRISPGAECAHRNSNTMQPVEIPMRKSILETGESFAFCLVRFYLLSYFS